MTFKDIVNREVVNLSSCEHEPIHIPGSIQPHGFLIGLKRPGLEIDYCSGNILAFTGLSHQQVLGRQITDVFGSAQAGAINAYIQSDDHSAAAPLDLEIAGSIFTCTTYSAAELHVLELEPRLQHHVAVTDFYRQARQFTRYMQQAGSLQQLCQSVADETRAITGYDRVMVYRFDEAYNGEVYAESRVDSVEPFFGLHYPHTDIPAQARELYLKNMLRLIVDVGYTPVPIYTIADAENKQVDLGLSTLRSVSPIHIQYLKNMGVAATLTISLVHQNRLWGLIACHHYSPKYISHDDRIAALLQGHFLTSQIDVRQVAEEYGVARQVNQALDELLAKVSATENFTIEQLIREPELAGVANAAAIIIEADNRIYSQGKVPDPDEISQLINWLHTHDAPNGFSTENLSALYPDAKKWCDSISGIIFHSLGSGPNNAIIWCRPHALEEVRWAGDPRKAIIKDNNGLSPRKSFEIWKEVKSCQGRSWLKPELHAALNFAHALQKQLHIMFLSREEMKQRKLSEKLREANAELENINYIGSHDLQEPLRKIQVFASRIIDEEDRKNYDLVTNSLKKINVSAERMQLLIKDILSYSQLRHVEEAFVPTELARIVKSATDELHDEIREKRANIEYNDLPRVMGVRILLQQLFLNLLRNALKFARPGTDPKISIMYSGEMEHPPGEPSPERYYSITVADNGIGFDNAHRESIFKVFTRLNDPAAYAGSGVGLALCRKIMTSHKGYISASGETGAGATFTLLFPVHYSPGPES